MTPEQGTFNKLRAATPGRTIGRRRPTEPRNKEMPTPCPLLTRRSVIKARALNPVEQASRKSRLYEAVILYEEEQLQ
jgi:hypothetical protein